MEALHLEVSKAEVNALKQSQRFAREMAKATEFCKTACRTLRLALTNMGARVRAAFTMGLLQQFGCEHIAEFPNFAKEV
uniref:Uncharacterized protein n=1 Tax=Oryza punctata TaxID=4537 RepID=A0A0E0LJ48_ORYPU